MSIETAFKALETAMTRCTALHVEMKTVPVEDRGRFMRASELLDFWNMPFLRR